MSDPRHRLSHLPATGDLVSPPPMNKNLSLVFIPWPGISHLTPTINIAHLFLHRNHRLSVTVLLIPPPWEEEPITTAHLHSLLPPSSTSNPIRFISLPRHPLPLHADYISLFRAVVETQTQNVKETVAKLFDSAADSPKLAGFVIDMFCTPMIDVANEFGVPSYVFFTASAGYLSLTFHLQELYDQHDKESQQFAGSDVEMVVPGFTNPVPGKVIPSAYLNKNTLWIIHQGSRRIKESSGILINTFSELEPQLLNSFSGNQFPPVYAVGPILDLKNNISAASEESDDGSAEILKWLDEQPPSSVVLLCFGNWGSLDQDQVKEIAHALERSEQRFVWSLRQPSPGGKSEKLIDHVAIAEVLPEGFLDRTSEIGRVIGWAPQVEILGHPATGGFISHCGWNSTLESLWYGVPIGTWPMYAEQRLNAFEMEVELGLAVGVSSAGEIVSAEKIESGIRKLMAGDSEVRRSVKAKMEESRRSVREGGSSLAALDRFMEEQVMAKKANK